MLRLAIVQSHPTQYFSPWFRHLAQHTGLQIKVFYLWDFGVKETVDIDFRTSFVWDIPLLDGYESAFLPNCSSDPGTHHFFGLNNPGAVSAIADWKPDALLIFGYGYATHLKLILAPQLNGIPLLFRGDSHELYPKRTWRSWVGRCLRRLIFHRFSGFLAVGKANTHYFLQVGVEPERIFRSPHCVDNERFQQAAPAAEEAAKHWKAQLGIPPQSAVILFAGKMEQKKCPLELLTAFLDLPKESGEAQKAVLLFVGGGILEQPLRDLAGAEIGKRVFFAPFQNQSSMPKVYATGDVLVLPSYGRGETWGLAVNEAMNMARPAIVSSHCGGSRDLILQGETGWMFAAGDWDELRNTLEMAINDPERLKVMGLAAREHIANFSYDCATKGLLRSLGIKAQEQLPR